MRAHLSPTRMREVARLAEKFARRLANLCPACGTPGFGTVKSESGLPCAECGAETELVKTLVSGCVSCKFTENKPRSDGLLFATAAQCPECNPRSSQVSTSSSESLFIWAANFSMPASMFGRHATFDTSKACPMLWQPSRASMAALLLNRGAKVDASDGEGKTPLMVAVRNPGLALPRAPRPRCGCNGPGK